MLQEPQATLHNNILEDASRRNVDCAALRCNDDDRALQGNAASEIHGPGDGEMIELDDLWDAGNTLLEVTNLLEVGTQLDQRRRPKAGLVDHELSVLQAVQV